jgi:uncharacterized protein YndB with AHSA1/START domain
MATVVITRTFRQSPEQVFSAWVDPVFAAQWLFRTPDGELIRADFDARPGAGFNITERREDGDAAHLGTYVEIDPPRRLVFDFLVEPYSEGQSTRVSIDVVPTDGGCELTLTHEGVWEDWEERTKQGWEFLLGRLGEVLSNT